MTLTLKEVAVLSAVEAALTEELVGIATASLLYGTFALLLTLSVYLRFQNSQCQRPGVAHNVLFGATVLSFCMATVYVGCRLSAMIIVTDGVLVHAADSPLEALLSSASEKLVTEIMIISWAAFIPAVVVDGTIIWRVWVLVARARAGFITLPCLLWLGTFATTLSYVVWICTPAGFEQATHPAPTVINNLVIAGISLSNVTNLASTLLFGWTLWELRQGLKGHKTPVQALMAITVESGTIYLILQFLYLVYLIKPPRESGWVLFFYVLAASYSMVSAMYPTAVMVITKLNVFSEVVISSFKLSLPVSDPTHADLPFDAHINLAQNPPTNHPAQLHISRLVEEVLVIE